MSRMKPMPPYYGRNIARNAVRRVLKRQREERTARLEEERDARRLYEAEKRADEYERGERDHL